MRDLDDGCGSHMDVGDQKFISLSSDGLASMMLASITVLSADLSSVPMYVRFCDDIDLFLFNGLRGSASARISSSSSIFAVMISLDCPSILARIQLPWYLSLSGTNAPVKYLLACIFLRVFGEVSGLPVGDVDGVAGKDLLILLDEFSICWKRESDASTFIGLPDVIRVAT